MRHNFLFSIALLAQATFLVANEEEPFQLISLDQKEELAVEKLEEKKPVASVKKTKAKKQKALELNTERTEEEPLLDEGTISLDLDLYKPANQVLENERKEEPMLAFELEEPQITPPQKVDKVVAHVTPAVQKAPLPTSGIQISMAQVFSGSPIIYSLLLTLSVFAVCICLYNLLSLRSVSENFARKIRQKLMSNQFDEALALCLKDDHLFSRVLGAAISARKHGLPQMLETMKNEGKRNTVGFWQRIALLNDIAIVAPMLGLLGTVLGMFYAFYDLNRSRESVNTLFDGLGISVGTTVAGLAVAIIAMMLHSFSKYRLIRVVAKVEEEANSLATLMETKPHNF